MDRMRQEMTRIRQQEILSEAQRRRWAADLGDRAAERKRRVPVLHLRRT
jgi:hypothetical protein